MQFQVESSRLGYAELGPVAPRQAQGRYENRSMLWINATYLNAKLLETTLCVAMACALTTNSTRADSIANIWLSYADTGPTVPVMYVPPGATAELQVWARPAEGYRLSAFALDLTTAQPGVVSLTNVDVLNPQLAAMPPLYRHQIVFDSAAGLVVDPSEIYGFLGYSFFENAMGLSNGAGIGPQCGDCSTSSGAPAWHVATVEFQAGMSLGSVELFLSIGEQGVWQSPGDAVEPDAPSDTSVVFGLPNDAVNQWAVLGRRNRPSSRSPGSARRRDPQSRSADFNQDGDVDGDDFLTWQRGLGIGSTLADGDADGDGEVDADDLAAWRFQFGSTNAAVARRLGGSRADGIDCRRLPGDCLCRASSSLAPRRSG